MLKKITINGKVSKTIGQDSPVFFIAEVGNNHNGDYYLAKKTIEEAVRSGADAVKFQKRSIQDVFTKSMQDTPQTKDTIYGETYGEYRSKLELTNEELARLKDYTQSLGAIFFTTPFDAKSADDLDAIGADLYKIASFDSTNLPLLAHVAKKGKPIILSVGMTEWSEVDEAVNEIVKYNDQLSILHCVSVYPTPDDKLNLSVITEIQRRYPKYPIGYSGHEQDILASLTAVALGAKIIERHITLDKRLPGPDHATVSIEPHEFKLMVDQARRIEKSFGSFEQKLLNDELKARNKHSKSIVTLVDVRAGDTITASMLTCKSPGYGLKPRMLSEILGKTFKSDLAADTVVTKDNINY